MDVDVVYFAHQLSKLSRGELSLEPSDEQWSVYAKDCIRFGDIQIGWIRIAIALFGQDWVWVLDAIRPVFKVSFFGWPGDEMAAVELLHAWWHLTQRMTEPEHLTHAMWEDRMRTPVPGYLMGEREGVAIKTV